MSRLKFYLFIYLLIYLIKNLKKVEFGTVLFLIYNNNALKLSVKLKPLLIYNEFMERLPCELSFLPCSEGPTTKT